jgi:hypothetical protein
MDDNFTTGAESDDKPTPAGLTWFSRRLDTMAVDLRELVLEQREMRVLMMEMNRAIMRRQPVEPVGPSLTDRLRDEAATWQMYANLQSRMDRLDRRLEEIERKLEPPLPPFPEFKPKP